MTSEPERRALPVDLETLDLGNARTEALRLLASPETDIDVHLAQAARVLTGIFDGLELDAVDDATLSELARRTLEIIAGLTIVGYRSVTALAEQQGVDRAEVLRQIETQIEEDEE
jgi:hypothetical protein